MSDYYVVLKLITGEQVMATLTAEDEEYVELYTPIIIKTMAVMRETGVAERVTAQPFNPYSDETFYRIAQKNILYMKPLHETFVFHYKRFVDEIQETTLVRKEESGSVTPVEDEQEEVLSIEEIQRRIDMLQAIATAPRTTEEEDDKRIWVEGNDTIN